jgi:hypothetical protein
MDSHTSHYVSESLTSFVLYLSLNSVSITKTDIQSKFQHRKNTDNILTNIPTHTADMLSKNPFTSDTFFLRRERQQQQYITTNTGLSTPSYQKSN